MLENTRVGQKVNCSDFLFENKDIVENDDVYKRINCKSYRKNDDISLSDLTYIKMLHYNYDDDVVVGEMIVNKVILDEVREVFSSLFMLKYQINSMRLIDDFGWKVQLKVIEIVFLIIIVVLFVIEKYLIKLTCQSML